MGITERREKEKSAMRNAILDAAMQLFVDEGYESVSIRRIAEKIEYSPSTIYLYFEDKDAIFYELHILGFNELYKHQIEAQKVEDPRERLIEHGRGYIQFALNNPEFYDIMFILRSPIVKIKKVDGWECGDRSFNMLVKNIEECKAAGYFKNSDVLALSFMFWSLMHGMVSLHIRNRIFFLEDPEVNKVNENFFENTLAVIRTLIR